jgi:hypothetical protein
MKDQLSTGYLQNSSSRAPLEWLFHVRTIRNTKIKLEKS